MRRLLAVELAAIATLSIVAALGWHRVFLGGGYLLPAIGAAALAVATSTVLGFVRRLSVLATGLVNIVAFGLFVMAAVLNDTMRTGLPTLSTFAEMARGLTGGWADLLTATLPTASEPRMLVSVAAVSWIGAGISAELVQRRRGVLGPVVGPLGAYTVTLMASASEPSSPLGLPLALIGVALLAVLVHANRWATMEPDGQRVRGLTAAAGEIEPSVELSADRRVMTGLPIVALAVACALAASALPASALRHRFDPRSLRSQEIEELPQISPLASVYAQLTAPEEREIFQIAVAPADRAFVTEVRLAALDRFDGATWSTSGRYAKVASILPDRGLSSVETRLVDQEYLLRDPSGPWLPVVAMPISLSLARSATVGYDSASGTALVSDGLAPEFRYSVRSEVAVPSDDAIAQAVAGSADEAGPFALELPAGMPDSLAAATSQLAGTSGSLYERLQQLASNLSDDYRYSEVPGPGSSYGHLDEFLSEQGRGYSEQFAAVFALMARILGAPSRLVVGFRVGDDEGDDTGPGPLSVTNRDADIWPEVYFEKLGWVAFDPTPERVPDADTTEPPQAEAAELDEPLVEQAPAPGVEDGGGEGAGDTETVVSSRLLTVVVLLTMLVALAGGLVGAKALVRQIRRRGAGSPSQRVLAAWREVIDRLLEVGVPVAQSMTARDVARETSFHLPERAVSRLDAMVPLVTAAIFAPYEPEEADAVEVEYDAATFKREALASLPVKRRIRAVLSPRPLIYLVRSR